MNAKVAYISLITMLLSQTLMGQVKEGFASFYVGGWDIQVVGQHNFYPTYLADPLAVRFDLSSQYTLASTIDMQDGINSDGSYLGKFTIKPATRLSLFRISPANKPNLGIEIDFGVALPFTMRKSNFDFVALDGIYFIGISGAPTEWLSLRLAKHHICTHRGVEFWAGKVDAPIDFDPLMFNLYVRDDVVFSAAMKPLYFLGKPDLNILQIYGDISTFIPGEGKLGKRQNKPNTHAYYVFQGGVELEYSFKSSFLGGVFAAANVSAWQENGYSPNYSLIAGYIFPQPANKRKLRIGLNYYDGRCINNEFFNYNERFFAIQLAADL